jgi:MFS family permease
LLYIVSLFLQSFVLLDYSAVAAGAGMLALSGMMFVVSLFAGRVLERIGARWTISGALVLMGLGPMLVSFFDVDSGYGVLVPGFVVFGAGAGLAFGPTSGIGLRGVPSERAGEASGVINLSRYIGGAVVVAISGAVYLGTATGALNDSLAGDRLTPGTERTLDRALAGSQSAAEASLRKLPARTRSDFNSGAREATVDAWRNVTRLNAGIALFGALAALLLLGGARQRKEHAAHHARVAPAAPAHTAPP